MIAGIGVDLVDLARFEKQLENTPALRDRLFHEAERDNSVRQLAGSFAAKEALYKALSPSHGLQWHEAEVINLENGKPEFLFRGEIAEMISGSRVHLSLSHDAGIASAIVVIEEKA